MISAISIVHCTRFETTIKSSKNYYWRKNVRDCVNNHCNYSVIIPGSAFSCTMCVFLFQSVSMRFQFIQNLKKVKTSWMISLVERNEFLSINCSPNKFIRTSTLMKSFARDKNVSKTRSKSKRNTLNWIIAMSWVLMIFCRSNETRRHFRIFHIFVHSQHVNFWIAKHNGKSFIMCA